MKVKVLLICSSNMKFMPYVFVYLRQLIELKCEITLFYWDRTGKEDVALPNEVEVVCHKYLLEDQLPKYRKITAFLKYRRAAIKVMKARQYDKIIIFNTHFAVLLSDILLKRYRRKYIFDYRDPSFERYKLYQKRLNTIVLNSKTTFISSDGYRQFMPPYEHIYTMHNMTMADLTHREERRVFPRKRDVLRIAFWGAVREFETNISLINGIGNDGRFEMHYYGTMGKNIGPGLQKYCAENHIHNIYFHKEYTPEERYEFCKTTDIIHNVTDINVRKQNMHNKFYDGLVFYIPQICTEGGFMGAEVVKHGVGMTFDPARPFADRLYRYYNDIDWRMFEKNCNVCLDAILKEQEDSNDLLKKMVMEL
jgi:hypothetical protein